MVLLTSVRRPKGDRMQTHESDVAFMVFSLLFSLDQARTTIVALIIVEPDPVEHLAMTIRLCVDPSLYISLLHW